MTRTPARCRRPNPACAGGRRTSSSSARPECFRPTSRHGLSLFELVLVTALIGLLATTVVPSMSLQVDALDLATRRLTSDVALARRLAVTFDADCVLTLTAGGDALEISSPDATVAAELSDLATSMSLGTTYVRPFGASVTSGQVAVTATATGVVTGAPVTSLTFAGDGLIAGRFDNVAVVISSQTHSQTAEIDVRTGAVSVSPLTRLPSAGGSS